MPDLLQLLNSQASGSAYTYGVGLSYSEQSFAAVLVSETQCPTGLRFRTGVPVRVVVLPNFEYTSIVCCAGI